MDFGQKGNIILYFSQTVHVFANDNHQQCINRCKLGQREKIDKLVGREQMWIRDGQYSIRANENTQSFSFKNYKY